MTQQIQPKDITIDFLKKRPLSKSSLHQFNKSPLHYVKYLNEKKDSSGFLIGNLFDCLILEPEKFEERYHVYEACDKRTKIGKILYENALNESKNRTLITQTDYQTVKYMKESLMANYEARKLVEAKKDVQKKLNWIDKTTGLPLTGFIDFRANAWDTDYIVDLKTSQSADPIEFNKFIVKFGYDLQAAMYLDYYKRIRFEYLDFCFIVTENSHPYITEVIHVPSKFIQKATDAMIGTLMAFKKALTPKDEHPNHFHMGYSFRLMAENTHHWAEYPAWHKAPYLGFE